MCISGRGGAGILAVTDLSGLFELILTAVLKRITLIVAIATLFTLAL
ncbi:hypothetical protein [Anabaena azotica]|uniref:Uncharacterized protein n=1 Tax=Anabaena azotica FACHB-119 TaxID=947527 RepID=A0ABR8D500_9NOST|nr:hypothetical protein [Anabaena azotica]MBD2502239.1 hypothetical protein [Anabaena azotica FACHB-119]